VTGNKLHLALRAHARARRRRGLLRRSPGHHPLDATAPADVRSDLTKSPSPSFTTQMPSRTNTARRPPRLPPFERVLEEHGPAVLRFCMAHAGPQRADDCFQETLLAALCAYAGVRDPQAIKAWLFSIAARKAIDAHRASARAPEPTDQIDEQAVAAPAALADEADIWEQVRALPDKQRQAVTLRYRGDLVHREVADAMGTTEAAARRNVYEGLERLRKDM
jgi:RNA polymerase sigma factor (sigma-70 family)